ncbi:MAG: hypothetical protein PF486_02980 [Prolixibacteraceae bacterium]|jgi:hypothetical protein|nr:hypothetical protein [Prolixibacteraceae bacterium]
MKLRVLFILFFISIAASSFSQSYFPVEYRVEKEAMSTPMTPLYDMFFDNYYHAKPVNVNFDGSVLKLLYDNGRVFSKKEVTKVDYIREEYNGELEYERFLFTDNENPTDTISFVVDHLVDCYQISFPEKNSNGENIGYKSYRHFVEEEKLVLR